MNNVKMIPCEVILSGYNFNLIFFPLEQSVQFETLYLSETLEGCDTIDFCKKCVHDYMIDNSYSDVNACLHGLKFLFKDEAEYNRFYFEHA